MVERSDALVLAVSEERGTISVASDGELRTLAPSGALRANLAALLTARLPPEPVRPWHWLLTQNLRERAIAVGLSLLLWVIFVASQGSGVVTRPYEVPVEFHQGGIFRSSCCLLPSDALPAARVFLLKADYRMLWRMFPTSSKELLYSIRSIS